jgi:predicted transposase YdaD
MHEIDQAVKHIARSHPHCFMSLFFGHERNVKLQGVEDAQIQIPEHRADKVWRIHDGNTEGYLMLEAILQPARRDFRKLNLKNAAVQAFFDAPVITVLVYLQRGEYATFPESYEDELGGLRNGHRFARVLLWEHADRIRSGELKELAPFLPLFEKDPGPEVLEQMNSVIEAVADPEERLELKTLGAIIASRKFAENLVKQVLNLESPMIRETTIFSEWLDQAEAKGRIEGYAEGENKGRHLTLQKLLERKFGPLTTELSLSLQKLRSEELEALTTAIFDLQSLDEFRAWLQSLQAANFAGSLKH